MVRKAILEEMSGDSETEPSTVEEAKKDGEAFEDTTEIKDSKENDVIIPGGFKIAEDSGTSVEEGIVIQDSKGNQFVWIPVGTYQTVSGAKTNNLSRRIFTSGGATEVTGDNAIESNYYGEGNSNSVAKNQIGAFKASATSNKGFYIGRYEAGTEKERTSLGSLFDDTLTVPLTQKSLYPYVYITRNEAKTQSEAMYIDNSYVTSELMSSYAWDTALNFICQNNTEGYKLALVMTDSSYGNLSTGSRTKTGEYIKDGKRVDGYSNIYDMVGNCTEWTTEYDATGDNVVFRGGNYQSPDSGPCAAERWSTGEDGEYISFRVQLYIK